MKLQRVLAYRVKSIVRLEHAFYDDWLGQCVDGAMVIGPNGSGKSTLLEGIAALWEAWGDWLDASERGRLTSVGEARGTSYEPARLPVRFPLFAQPHFGLLALEWVGLDPRRSVWLAAGGQEEVIGLQQQYPDAYLVAAVGQQRDAQGCLQEWGLLWPGAPQDHSWLSRWADLRQRSLLGAAALPNILYFESDNRQLLSPQEDLDIAKDLQDPPIFNWLARYAPQTRRAGHLSSMLYRMQITDPEEPKVILDEINVHLQGKQVEGFTPTGDLEVTIGASHEQIIRHLIYELSSGERQVFILVAMLRRWLRQGGIVLIDEPELHLHPSLRGALLTKLQRIVAEKEGQLIITCQSERMWSDYYRRPPERIELGPQVEVREE